ncbi:MAG: LD-carboxypeptidase [Eubacteriaceae bacterium]|nr:LD-carboxypeptidase [Eubacteriaceae bacterium]
MIKPKALKKGDTIGVVSPASPSEKRSEVARAKAYLEEKGYRVVIGKNVNKTKGFTAASEDDRASDINEMFARDDIDAVFVTQGGYGSAQLVDKLDYECIRKNPKIFTGFSDITSLHLAFQKFCDLVTFHGPGMARFNEEDLTEYTRESFFKMLGGTEEPVEIKLADPKKYLVSMGHGSVQAPIVGGNLTLICASLGTDYEIDCKDKILFIEDVDTEPWIFDHNMCHLRNAGKLDDCAAILVGECENCVPFKYEPGYLCDTSLEDVLYYYLEPLNKPVLFGLPLGHTDDLATLPMGVMCELDADTKSFTVLESGVR